MTASNPSPLVDTVGEPASGEGAATEQRVTVASALTEVRGLSDDECRYVLAYLAGFDPALVRRAIDAEAAR